MIKKLASKRHIRFVLIGICNATISFGILNLMFYKLHTNKIVASVVATTCALIFSFILNRGYVFGDRTKKYYKQVPAFVVVSISGSIILLNLVYILFLKIITGHEHFIISAIKSSTGVRVKSSLVDINLSTVFGAIAALFWNYYGYKKYVFKGSRQYAIEETAEHIL